MERYRELLKVRLTANRYRHSLNVAKTAAELAAKNGVNPEQARLAGLLHDYARDMKNQDLLRIAAGAGLITSELEVQFPVLLHGPVGAFLIREELAVTDEAVCRAVARHTVGAAEMTVLEKIIYLADLIEPQRNFKGVKYLRSLAYKELDFALLRALDASISHILTKKKPLHLATVEARNHIILTGGDMFHGRSRGG